MFVRVKTECMRAFIGNKGTPRENVDMLIKSVRVVSNLCVHPPIGSIVAAGVDWNMCFQGLQLAVAKKEEELVLNVLGLLGNLSFHSTRSFGGDSSADEVDVLEVLLMHENTEIVMSTLAVFANKTRSIDVDCAAQIVRSEGTFLFEYSSGDIGCDAGSRRCGLHCIRLWGHDESMS